MDFLVKRLVPHLAKPGKGFWGFVVRKYIFVNNRPLAEATFRALDVQPGDNVLELGFGYGPGLAYALDNGLWESSGKLYGVDYSDAACEAVSKEFANDVASGKLKILNEDVARMSLDDCLIDKVFHTNCYYFWPDMSAAAKEIFRVLKPGGFIVTGLNMDRLKLAEKRGLLKKWQYQPQRYTDTLSEVGFVDIRQDNTFNEETKAERRFLYAKKPH